MTEATMQNYQELALRTESPITPELIERLTGNARAVHAFFGLLTETGELADGFKRAIFYGKPLDTTNIKEEVGDVFWYLAILCDTLGISFIDCMEANIEKLRKRFPTKYSHEAALNRDLEAERKVLEGNTDLVAEVMEERGYNFPWLQPNDHGKPFLGICCRRATGKYCYEHDRNNYQMLGGEWVLKCETTEVKKPDPNCKRCEGTGQDGGRDASFNSPPCPECFPEHKKDCEHRVRELHADGSATCHYCRKVFTKVELATDTKADTGPLPEEETPLLKHTLLPEKQLNSLPWNAPTLGELLNEPTGLKHLAHCNYQNSVVGSYGCICLKKEKIPPINGFDVARELASWMDGQTRERALKHIQTREQQYKDQQTC